MASITTEGRNELIALYTAMFNAAPGASNLNAMVTAREGGKSLLEIAQGLTTNPFLSSVYPSLLTADEFAARLVSNLLGSEVSASASTYATNWVKAQLAAGKGPAFVISTAVQAIRSTVSPDFANAKTMLANKVDVASYYSVTKEQSDSDLADLQAVIAGITSASTSVTASKLAVDGIVAKAIGQTFGLTSGIDTIVGTAGDDVINGQTSGTPAITYTGLDTINGGAGKDTLNIFDQVGNAALPSVVVSNVEVVNFASSDTSTAAAYDFSTGFAGLTALAVSSGKGAITVTSGSANTVTVSGQAAVTLTGGSAQTVTSKNAYTVSGSTGDISASVTGQTANSSVVSGAKVTASAAATVADAGTGATLTIGGGTAALQPTGAVSATQSVSSDSDGGDIASGTLTINGGSTIAVTRTATNLSDAVAANTTTFGAVTITGGAATTSVSVTQPAAANERNSIKADAGTRETAAYNFVGADLAAGSTVTIEGLTLTVSAGQTMTAAEVAAAFANLAAGATQGTSVKGVYSGALTGYSTGAASTVATNTTAVTLTASTVGDKTLSGVTGSGAGIVAASTNVNGTALGVNLGAGFTAVAGVTDGTVTITDGTGTAADSIKSVTLSAYGNGSTITSDALTSLSLANNAGLAASATGATPVLAAVAPATVAVTNTLATSLDLTLDTLGRSAAGVSTFASVDVGATYKTLNVIGAGANSWVTLTAGGVESLAVSGDKTINLLGTGGGTNLAALKTVTVSGSAGLTVKVSATTTTSVTTTGTTGAVTITNLDPSVATYTGGAGVDTVTFTGAVPSKAIDLGAGNDKLTIAASTSTSDVKGGEGTDTLSMTGAQADAADISSAFAAKVTGFEILELTTPATDTVDLSVLGFSQVRTSGATGVLTLNKMASGGTLTLTAAVGAGSYVVGVTDAATGTADSLKLAVTSGTATAVAFGSVTAADVESIAISGSYTGLTAQTNAHTLTLVATKATAITVTGNETLDITNAGNTAVTKIDGSAMAGGLIVTAAGTVATTITGGSGADSLTASTGAGAKADTLIGGAGNDTLTSNNQLSILTGGTGADSFVVTAPANVNSYTTITDATAGDKIVIGTDLGAETFQKSAVTLGDTAVFQDFANAAVNAGGASAGYIAWFQFAGNTYIVQNSSAGTTDFQNGSDTIVKLTGLIDLSSASANTSGAATLQLN